MPAAAASRRALVAGLALGSLPQRPVTTPLTLPRAVDLIRTSCDPAFLAAVQSTGSFLYRGESLGREIGLLCAPQPDLLDAGTYGDEGALKYFYALERDLSAAAAVARPSTGHIGVASKIAAGEWGDVASVWPLGRPLHYAWPRDRDAFWSARARTGLGGAEALCIDARLDEALRLGRELLFASERGAEFVAISATADREVRRLLFGATVAGEAAQRTTAPRARPRFENIQSS